MRKAACARKSKGGASPRYQYIQDEFARTIKVRGIKHPKWFFLFDGPKSIRQLADRLNRMPLYDILYTHWSQLIHAEDLQHFLGQSGKGQPTLGRLRETQAITLVAMNAETIAFGTTAKMIEKFRAGDSLESWRSREFQPRYDALVTFMHQSMDSVESNEKSPTQSTNKTRPA